MNVRIVVEGKVQGVFYRASTKAKARQLSLNGFVKNQSDGSVLIEAQGSENNIEVLIEWCKTGPPAAKVENCQWEKIGHRSYSKFEIQ
ncbi:acylphosphatase [Hyphobacterium sp. CCMP332]|nr:acylphosphatase [Hyphobacterium sp. CCMP332]